MGLRNPKKHKQGFLKVSKNKIGTKWVFETEVVMEQHDVTTLLFAVPELSDGPAPLKPSELATSLFPCELCGTCTIMKRLHAMGVLARLGSACDQCRCCVKFLV